MKISGPTSPRQAVFRQQSPLPRPAAGPQDEVEISSPSEVPSPPVSAPPPTFLHRMGVGGMVALSLLGAVGLTGCTAKAPPEAPQEQTSGTRMSYSFMSVQEEVELGNQVAQRVEAETPVWHNAEAQARLDRLGQRLAGDSFRKDITYSFKLLDTDAVNAMALPGGRVYVTRGLMQNYADDAELTFVVGHEFGHVEQRHSVKQLEKATAVDVLVRLATRDRGQGARVAGQLAEKLLGNQFSQADESEADRIGQMHLVHLGMDPGKAASAMERLMALTGGADQSRIATRILGDHPPTQDRVDALRQGAQRYQNPPAQK